MLQGEIPVAESYLNGLTEHQAAYLRHYPCPQLFAIVSWGCAATAWIAAALNRHPDIFCAHAANITWHYLGACERLDGLPYMRIIGSQGHASVAAGDVHGVSRHLIAELRQAFGRKFNAAVVIREPLPRIRSQLGIFPQFGAYPNWQLEYLDPLIARAGVRLPSDDESCRFFVHAANMLNAIEEEVKIGKVFRAEDVTRHPESLGRLVDEITRGKVRPGDPWLQKAVNLPRRNGHSGPKRVSALEDWQYDVIRRVVSPKSWELYEHFGYPAPDFI
jgi:hypothetical protein